MTRQTEGRTRLTPGCPSVCGSPRVEGRRLPRWALDHSWRRPWKRGWRHPSSSSYVPGTASSEWPGRSAAPRLWQERTKNQCWATGLPRHPPGLLVYFISKCKGTILNITPPPQREWPLPQGQEPVLFCGWTGFWENLLLCICFLHSMSRGNRDQVWRLCLLISCLWQIIMGWSQTEGWI